MEESVSIDYIKNLLRSYQSVEGEVPIPRLVDAVIDYNSNDDMDKLVMEAVMHDRDVFGHVANVRGLTEWLPTPTLGDTIALVNVLENENLTAMHQGYIAIPTKASVLHVLGQDVVDSVLKKVAEACECEPIE